MAGAPEENCDRRQRLDQDYANDGVVRKPGEEEVTHRTSLLEKKQGGTQSGWCPQSQEELGLEL